MGDTTRASGNGMQIDTQLVRELADMLAETGLTEIEVEDGDRKIRVSRGAPPALQAAVAPMPAAPVAGASAPPAEAGAAPAADMEGAIKSPMVGTAYLSAEPGGAAFVKVGDTVKAGDTLLIVEAMKVMNPITAPSDGTIKAILVENAQPVEYGQPLAVVG